MCTRFTLHHRRDARQAVEKALGRRLAGADTEAEPDYNVAPTRRVPVAALEGDGEPEWRSMLWGLLPFYERGAASAQLLPNARSETAASSPAFRSAVAHRRCLVPANGFYEWRTVHGRKLPQLFTVRGGEPFAFAGIWQPGGSDSLDTFAVLTTEPNSLVAPVHDRMPVLLLGEAMSQWIGRDPLEPGLYARLVRPLAPELMERRELGMYLNNTRNNGPECHASLPPQDSQLDLF